MKIWLSTLLMVLGLTVEGAIFQNPYTTNADPTTVLGVVTNGSFPKFGFNYATGMWGTNATTGAGGTNDFYIINSFLQPTLNLTHYHWAQDFGAYTNYGGTNLSKMWFDGSNLGTWIIGTNISFTDDGSHNMEYYAGASPFPTNDAANWFTNNFIPTGHEPMFDLVTTITSSNNYTIHLETNGSLTMVVNPYNYALDGDGQDNIVKLLAAPWTNGATRSIIELAQEAAPSYLIPRIMLHCYYVPTNNPTAMFNALRINSVIEQMPNDNRGTVLKGEVDAALAGYSTFMIETHAGPGAPGIHGFFLNPFMITTNGTTAIGNLTDAADDNNNTLKPPAWLSLYGDGSAWSGGSSTIPSFAILSKPLVATPVAAAEENDGNYRYWTDNSAARHKYLVEGVTGNGGSLTNLQGGFNTTGTYTNFLSATGFTNQLGFDVRVLDLQGTSIYLTNIVNGRAVSIGTISVNNDFLTLHTNEAVKGTGMSGIVWQ